MNIQGRHVLLRAIEPEDLPKLQQWGNDPEIQRLLGGWHFPTSMADQRAWLASLNCNSRDQRYAIEAPGLGLVGSANLVSIDWKNGTAFHGTMIGEREHRGRGLGRDTVAAIMRFAFEELRLEHLDTDIIEYNEASLKSYVDRCGWEIQGRKCGWYFRDGRRWDKIVLGISAVQYRDWAVRTAYWASP